MKYIAYYRTSTKDQDLGIDAQKRLVKNVLNEGDEIIASFEEKVSGTGKQTRHEFHKALEACDAYDAKLIIAKLDRLSRDKHLIFDLQKRGTKFMVADNPNANEVVIDIMAILAHDEVKKISQRTKEALAELKAKGVKLGTPANLTDAARKKGVEAIKRKAQNNPNSQKASWAIEKMLGESKTYTLQQMADELNKAGFVTPRGKDFSPKQISRIINKLKQK